MTATSHVDVEQCVGAALFQCNPVECETDLECADGLFCNGEETCGAGNQCDDAINEPCGVREICLEDIDACVEE